LKCSHGQTLELPVALDKKQALILVADLGETFDWWGTCVDPVTLQVKSTACPHGHTDPMTGCAYPLVKIKDEQDGHEEVILKEKTIRLRSPEIEMVDSLGHFLEHFFMVDATDRLANKYSISTQMCEGDKGKFATDIYVYPKIKWNGEVSFGYANENVHIDRAVRRDYSRTQNKANKKNPVYQRIQTADVPGDLNKHSFTVNSKISLWLGDKKYDLELPFTHSKTRQEGWGGKLIDGLTKIRAKKDKLGTLLKADKKNLV
jgi:hypothetical protein